MKNRLRKICVLVSFKWIRNKIHFDLLISQKKSSKNEVDTKKVNNKINVSKRIKTNSST